MASSRGRLPYHQRMESRTSQPYYHADDICGSSMHGLATSIQQMLQDEKLQAAYDQIEACIDARLYEMSKRRFPDKAHNLIVEQLRAFRNDVWTIKTTIENNPFSKEASYINSALVRYRDTENPHHFEIDISKTAWGTKRKSLRKKSIGKKSIGKKSIGKKSNGKKSIGKKSLRKKSIRKNSIRKKSFK